MRLGSESSRKGRARKTFVLTKGIAAVSVQLGDGGRHRVASLGPGTTFGELAILDGAPRAADVDAETSLICYALHPGRIVHGEAGFETIRAKLFETVARDLAWRLRQANRQISALAS